MMPRLFPWTSRWYRLEFRRVKPCDITVLLDRHLKVSLHDVGNSLYLCFVMQSCLAFGDATSEIQAQWCLFF